MVQARPLNLRYTPLAAAELAALLDYIRHRSPAAADKVAARLKPLIDLLPSHPCMGRLSQIPKLRVLPVRPYPYLVFYEVGDEDIVILAFRHAVQDPSTFPDL
ncbi:type II toxin-antitoxin system RelE/ParE family toxin [Rhizobium sp. SL86]|jgi:plasmid stabilization system protein ParE|uniref:type II toxin-antitoxin system RelE/ParE family toxin n=1 Tax=Rhizobium sp. SL86 TaxID=2995148 RepID=UPI00227649B6|nr:type II toxin-antitoxin system RelE/ParE family toxin [Rhizobium sp. SL86]MCY1668917.1 type II toxin-antitoxin system RelE/ParE family toxin [Rhizobium sp. SL86]